MINEELIAKLEAATEGSRELDDKIANEMWWRKWGKRRPKDSHSDKFTTSILDALKLVPEGHNLKLKQARHRLGWRVNLWKIGGAREDTATPVSADAPTPTLAICIAALKAMKRLAMCKNCGVHKP